VPQKQINIRYKNSENTFMQSNQPDFEVLCTVEEMLFPNPKNDDVLFEERRKKGRHSLQIVMDTIAYAQNIQVRVLRPAALIALPEKIKGLITGKKTSNDVRFILEQAGLAKSQHKKLYDPHILKEVHDWMAALVLGERNIVVPRAYSENWLKAMVALLPHIEAKIWLTSISNPLPAHALCRMQSTWALYVLLSVWHKMQGGKTEYSGDDPTHIVTDTMGIKGFIGRPMAKFSIPDENGEKQDCVLVTGPTFEISKENHDGKSYNKSYQTAFKNFNDGLASASFPQELRSTVNEKDINDALLSRIEFHEEEVKLRSENTLDTLRLLISAQVATEATKIHNYSCGSARIFTRTEWFAITALCTWLIRWSDMIGPKCVKGEKLLLNLEGREIALLATCCGKGKLDWAITIIPYDINKAPEEQLIGATPIKAKLAAIEGKKVKGNRIDRFEILYNRIRERQNAAWARQINAVNNLLIRHGSANAEWVPDDVSENELSSGVTKIKAGQANHLLKGFGKQICKYVADITRADLADIFWLDYSQSPPRLIHAAGYARAIPHIVQSDEIFRQFDEWAWKPSPSPDAPANLGKDSPSQCYQVIATGKHNSHEENERSKAFYVDCYDELKPEDSTAVPLLVNNRVIGVLLLGGLVPFQFTKKLLTPLQAIASMVASTMYQQSQLWQMRRLNSLFTKTDISLAFREGAKTENVLKGVVSCLTNIFLCPVVQIWLCDESLRLTYQLKGYNWPSPTHNTDAIPSFEYRPLNSRPDGETSPAKDSFFSLAADLWESNKVTGNGSPCLAKFVQGQYDPTSNKTSTGYSGQSAHTKIAQLGVDFLPKKLPSNADAHLLRREQIFRNYDMRDIMAFSLVRRQPHPEEQQKNPDWQIVGAITLHDRGGTFFGREIPWDSGWCPIVAHIQTYLPNLFTQAEILSNPAATAQAYYLHAARALTISMKDNATNLYNKLQKILSPTNSLSADINTLLASQSPIDPNHPLISAPNLLSEAWDAVQKFQQADWMNDLEEIANLMHQHKKVYAATTNIAVGKESFNLRTEIMAISQAYNDHYSKKQIQHSVEILEAAQLRLPLIQLRIVLYDLIHNAAKYTTNNGEFKISWNQETHSLLISNQGPYDAKLDQPELLMQYRVRGSAAKATQSIKQNANEYHKGTGTGLWGCKTVCGQIGVKFEFTIVEIKNAPAQTPIAWYNATLTFSEQMLISESTSLPLNYY
jgi:signal transduction histidine kinase